ncbi:Protein of unknown function [Halovenus aranensis]|jgi:hypothetical protein|uniref:DUF3179 domain-containing protein n=1 Tax=Halovenus aranensis TaxID=890420 RepID=A0A1G8YU80_9EURY|nr:DUF3179 domain-containing protein [Halovenus aranensis]SDK05635.1 Protein of unknown function [Halovenus aranensis]
MRTKSRRAFLAVAGAAALAGCTDGLSGGSESAGEDGASGSEASTPTHGEEPPTSAGNNAQDGGGEQSSTGPGDVAMPLSESAVSLSYELPALSADAVSGGPPKDGIPSIDEPSFDDAAWGDENIDPADPVFGVTYNGVTKAYPQYILVFHEIVNDTFDGENLAVTYCPLTGSALGFERGDVEFGVSGRLVNSNLIMYDRATDSWWPQIHPVNPDGELQGQKLSEVRVTWTTWERWRDTHPETNVLTEDTGSVRRYGSDPYGAYNPRGGYYEQDGTLFGPRHESDEFHAKEVFLGARTIDGKVAFNKDTLRQERLLETTVGETPYLAAHHEALDSAWVYRNTEEASVTAVTDGYEGPDGAVHAADELPLESVNAFDVFWFSWYGFYPETEVVA